MESILGSTTLMVNRCDNISALRLAPIHPEAVKSWWKQADLISCLSSAYPYIESVMPLLHVYRHHNSVNPESTLTPLSYLNVRLDALSENIMASFLLSAATRNTIAVGLSDPYGIPRISIHGFPVNSNIYQSITYEISKLRLLWYCYNCNLTHMSDW